MKSKKINKPVIFLIGCGAWGKNHLEVWRGLSAKKSIILGGVIEKNVSVRQELAKKYSVPVFAALNRGILERADAFDIVTPPSTHFNLVKKCLKYAPVFVEKPLTLSWKTSLALEKLSHKTGRFLFVGHIYRFNPAAQKLKEILKKSASPPFYAEALFSSHPIKLPADCGILFSEPHPFDIFDFLFEEEPECVYKKLLTLKPGGRFEDDALVILDYGRRCQAVVKLNWSSPPKTRLLVLFFPDKKIFADLTAETIVISSIKETKKIHCSVYRPLQKELETFVEALQNKKCSYPDGKVGARIVKIVEKIYKKK